MAPRGLRVLRVPDRDRSVFVLEDGVSVRLTSLNVIAHLGEARPNLDRAGGSGRVGTTGQSHPSN